MTLESEHWGGGSVLKLVSKIVSAEMSTRGNLKLNIEFVGRSHEEVQYSFEKGSGGAFHPCQNRILSNLFYDTRVRTLGGGGGFGSWLKMYKKCIKFLIEQL